MSGMQETSKVYIFVDEQGRVARCEGGYTIGNIEDMTQWLLIDEGTGDRYNLCQTHYFEGGLYTDDGILRYKLEQGAPALRSEAEIAADRAALPEPPEDDAEKIARLEAELNALLGGEG